MSVMVSVPLLAFLSFTVIHQIKGNFHALLLFRDESELGAIRDAVHRMVERAIALDGTCM